MSSTTVPRLSVMMFLQFFVWGSWYVTAPNYLGTIGFGAEDFGWTFAVGPIAGMISPFFVGIIADRFFAAEKVLGILHLAGGVIMLGATMLMKESGSSPSAINVVFFGYMLTYFPTLALTNSLAMKNMQNSEKQFPVVRVFGTIGWVVAGLVLSWVGWRTGAAGAGPGVSFDAASDLIRWETTKDMFYMTSAAAFVLGLYCFTLPHTPPVRGGKVSVRQLLGLDALVLLKNRSYFIFMLSSFLICIPLAFYYQITSRLVEMAELPIGQTMSYGQMSEIFFMLIMPLCFARLGVKWMLATGMACWVIRYTLFSFGAPDQVAWMIISGIVLHGICYDFFFVTGQIYTDQVAPKEIQGQAQGMLVLFTLGLGMFIGAQVASRIEARYTTPESKEYAAEVITLGEKIKELEGQLKGQAENSSLAAEVEQLQLDKKTARLNELKAIDWKPLWGIPGIFAAGIMGLFLALFRNPNRASSAVAADISDASTAAGS